MGKKNNIHAERSEAENFFEKIYNKGPKIHCLAGQEGFLLKSAKRCIRDSPYLGQRGCHGPLGPPPLDPLLFNVTYNVNLNLNLKMLDLDNFGNSWLSTFRYVLK